METGYPNGTATLLSLSDGSASLYLSSGGGVIGGHAHESVRKAAMAFVQLAGSLHKNMSRTDKFPLPQTGKTIFYVFTDDGILTVDAIENDLGNERHSLSPLFHAGHAVITELRLISNPSQRLVAAVIRDAVSEVRKLLTEGSDANAVNEAGFPALAIATSRKQTEIVQALLEAGANPNTTVTDQKAGLKSVPVINLAAANGETSILESLITAKANIEGKDATGLTPLMCAAFMGNTATLEILLKAGSALEARDSSGYTALIFASNSGRSSWVNSLLNHGADANARDNDKSTPIMFASQHGHDECVRLLLAAGADPKFQGNHGLSAIKFAKQNRRHQTEKILLGIG
jgi:ankyrin repeat protein